MLNLEVAIHAVDLVVSHMDLVHFLVLVVLFKSFRFIVTSKASLPGNAALEGTGHL